MEGRTCVLVTHAMPLFLPVCQHVVLLEDGKVAFNGDPKQAADKLQIQSMPPLDVAAEPHSAEVTVGKEGGGDKRGLEKKVDKPHKNEETQQVGAVNKAVYMRYLRDLGNPYWLATILAVLYASLV
jgi:ABC-type multidrug transport system ATPase subunit